MHTQIIKAFVKHAPELVGHHDEQGWVFSFNQSMGSQKLSREAILKLSREGWVFDIQLNNGTNLAGVDIVDAGVKLEYNVAGLKTFPATGISKWRPSHNTRRCLITPFVNQQEFTGAVEQAGPYYANDKYKREIKPGVFVDVYDVIDCFEVTGGALQHALKKILATGKRGHKTYEQDLIDILSSVERALFQHQETIKS